MLRRSLDRGVSERRRGRVVLVVILQRERVFGADQVIEIGHGLVGDEIRWLRDEGVFREVEGGHGGRIRRRKHVLAVRQLVVQHGEGDGIYGSGGKARRLVRDRKSTRLNSSHLVIS